MICIYIYIYICIHTCIYAQLYKNVHGNYNANNKGCGCLSALNKETGSLQNVADVYVKVEQTSGELAKNCDLLCQC